MKLSTKGRYAMIALTDLAGHDPERLVALSEIADRQDISLAYLEQLFVKLRRADIVESVRGPGGGYRLARPAARITLVDIVEALEGPLGMTECSVHAGACGIESSCGVRANWRRINDVVADALRKVTLAEMLAPAARIPRTIPATLATA